MLQDTRITLFLLAELVAALRANDPDTFKRWLYGGIEDLGEPAVTELLLDWLDPFITRVERDRIVACQPLARLGDAAQENLINTPQMMEAILCQNEMVNLWVTISDIHED